MRGGRPFDRDSSSRASTGTQGRRDFGDRGRGPFNDSSFPGDRTGDGAPGDERLKAIEVSFLPERHGLAPLAHRLARSWRAYSLFEVASLFLSKPEYHAIKLEVRPGPDSTVELFQCLGCKAVFLNRDALANHAFSKHFDRFCRKEETEGEAPKGNFVCVSRCGLSGALLGPPNYHSYNERVLEIHRTRYPGMPIEAYRQRIETLHDPAMIEKWKEEMKRQVTYRFGEGDQAVAFTRFADAEAWFRDHCLETMLKAGKHFVVPGTVVPLLDDAALRRFVQDAWQQESRFPLRLSIALRLAFRHLGMHTFKTAGGHTFLTAVVPNAIDPAHAVAVVQDILGFISTKPGCLLQELVDKVCAAPVEGAATETPPTEADVKAQLKWLVEKGHVIEFSDGRMAVPSVAVSRVQMAHAHSQPQRESKETRKQGGGRS
jgi:hypothetical protein